MHACVYLCAETFLFNNMIFIPYILVENTSVVAQSRVYVAQWWLPFRKYLETCLYSMNENNSEDIK